MGYYSLSVVFIQNLYRDHEILGSLVLFFEQNTKPI